MISDIWRCDGREILPLMPMCGSPLVGVMRVIFEVRAFGRIGRQWSRRWCTHGLVVQAAQAQLVRPTRG